VAVINILLQDLSEVTEEIRVDFSRSADPRLEYGVFCMRFMSAHNQTEMLDTPYQGCVLNNVISSNEVGVV
jgi:hypothetical protein